MTSPRRSYDRRAIMVTAVADARSLRRGMGLPWRSALALALRTAWAMARRQAGNLLATARAAARPTRIPNRDLLLTYRGDKGEATARTVRLIRVRSSARGLLVEAHCRLRGAVRCFRADQVIALADVASGRVCPDPRGYLADLEGAAA